MNLDKRLRREAFELVKDLYELGDASEEQLHKAAILCGNVVPVTKFSSQEIKKLREANGLTQNVLASLLQVSEVTVQKWENGSNKPSGPALLWLNKIQQEGIKTLANVIKPR